MRLPPMNALVVFEAAGRHQSILKAADEMNVTAGAVSRQIKKLEDGLGLKLFERTNRKVTLTDEGRLYWTSLNRLLGDIEAETRRLMNRTAMPRVHVRCSMLFMRHWLLPRFPAFNEAHPQLDISFAIAGSSEDMTPENDCSIRIGSKPWAGLHCDLLMKAAIVPICSPAYLAKHGPIRSPLDLAGHTLLHSMVHPEQWRIWLGGSADTVLASARGVTLAGGGLSYQAAIGDLGIALGRYCLLEDELRSRRLIVPLSRSVADEENYYLVARPEALRRPEYQTFQRWIIAEAAKSIATIPTSWSSPTEALPA